MDMKILEWLSPSSNLTNLSTIQRRTQHCRVEGTGDWLLESSAYSDWYRSGGLLWIHGVGKSSFSR